MRVVPKGEKVVCVCPSDWGGTTKHFVALFHVSGMMSGYVREAGRRTKEYFCLVVPICENDVQRRAGEGWVRILRFEVCFEKSALFQGVRILARDGWLRRGWDWEQGKWLGFGHGVDCLLPGLPDGMICAARAIRGTRANGTGSKERCAGCGLAFRRSSGQIAGARSPQDATTNSTILLALRLAPLSKHTPERPRR